MKRATFSLRSFDRWFWPIAFPSGRAHDAATLANSAPQKNSLFLNMTSGAIFLNLDAAKLAAKSGEQEKKPSMQRVPRDVLADFIKDGAPS